MTKTQLTRLIELGIARSQWDHVVVQDAIVALAQEAARTRFEQATMPQLDLYSDPPAINPPLIDSLTNNTSGTTRFDIGAIPELEIGTLDGVTEFIIWSDFNTVLEELNNAHIEIAEKINQMIAAIVGFQSSSFVSITSWGGEAPDGTLDDISTPSIDIENCVNAKGAINEWNKVRGFQSSLVSGLNYVLYALGRPPIQDNVNGHIVTTPEGWDMDTLNWNPTGPAATFGEDSITETSMLNSLDIVKQNIVYLVDTINNMLGLQGFGAHVIATRNSRSRFIEAYRD